MEGAVPRRLVGYGLVVGLDGTGDRSFGSSSGATHTVRSVVNLLKRFDVVIPEDRIRMRNVAVVAVTAEISPFARSGSRFDVQVSSLGDAQSLEGGVLWTTPLVLEVGDEPVGTAQGALISPIREGSLRRSRVGGGSLRIPHGGVLETALPGAEGMPSEVRLVLRDPDLSTAVNIATAINTELGEDSALPEDPGSVLLKTPEGALERMQFLAKLESLSIESDKPQRVLVDSRTGTVVVGGTIRVGPATISHAGITLTIGGGELAPATASEADGVTPPAPNPGALDNPALLAQNPAEATPTAARTSPARRTHRVERVHAAEGSSVQEVAAALHDAGVSPRDIAQILKSLRDAGVLTAEVVIQ